MDELLQQVIKAVQQRWPDAVIAKNDFGAFHVENEDKKPLSMWCATEQAAWASAWGNI